MARRHDVPAPRRGRHPEALLDASEARLKIIVTIPLLRHHISPCENSRWKNAGARAGDDSPSSSTRRTRRSRWARPARARRGHGRGPRRRGRVHRDAVEGFRVARRVRGDEPSGEIVPSSAAPGRRCSAPRSRPCVEAAAASLQVDGEEGRALRKRLRANVATLNEALVTGSAGTGRAPAGRVFFDDGFFVRTPSGDRPHAPAGRRVADRGAQGGRRLQRWILRGGGAGAAGRCWMCAHTPSPGPLTVLAGTPRFAAVRRRHSDEDMRRSSRAQGRGVGVRGGGEGECSGGADEDAAS